MTSSSHIHLAQCPLSHSLNTPGTFPVQGFHTGYSFYLVLVPDICRTSFQTSTRSLFKCHHLSKACRKLSNFELRSSPGVLYSPFHSLIFSIARKTTYQLIIHPSILFIVHITPPESQLHGNRDVFLFCSLLYS